MRTKDFPFVILLGSIVFVLLIALLKVFIVGSLLFSGIKAMSDKCGQKYALESFVNGDWFCPEKEDK